jgi:hypothetical protein
VLEYTCASEWFELELLSLVSSGFVDTDDIPLSISFSFVGNGCSPGSMGRFKAEQSCANLGVLNPDAGESSDFQYSCDPEAEKRGDGGACGWN